MSIRYLVGALFLVLLLPAPFSAADELDARIDSLYDQELKELFLWLHQNPELSHMEHKTSARLASELESFGYDVHTGIGGTGIVALL